MTTNSLMLIANSRYIIHAFAMLCSLFENNNYPIAVYLFESDVDDKDLDLLSKFVNLWPDKKFHPIHMETGKLNGFHTEDELPEEVYFRITGLDRLPKDIHNVLALDLDMTIKGDISFVFNLDLQDYALAACKDIFAYIFKNTVKSNLERLDLPVDYTYFNGGNLFFNLDKIRAVGGSEWIIDQGRKIGADKLRFLEQDLLNKIFYDNYLEIPWMRFNCPPVKYIMKESEVNRGIFNPLIDSQVSTMTDFGGYMDYSQAMYDQASVIHYLGPDKPWVNNRPDVDTFRIFDQAYRYYFEKSYKYLESII